MKSTAVGELSFALHGLAVSPGIAIGHAHLVSHALLEVAQYQVRDKDVAAELVRFDTAIEAVRAAAKDDGQNLVPPVVAAVKAGVTVGEISQVFREVFGEHRDPAYL